VIGTLPNPSGAISQASAYDEAMRRARECVPVLRERAQACEDARVLLRENEQLLHETGSFRFHQPKRFGGMELPFQAIVDIVAETARGCPSTAWNIGNLGCHHWVLAYYPEKTQREVWDANPDALIASSIALAAGRGRKVDGGFVVSGRWPFSSGVDNSDWNMLAVTVYDDAKTAVDWRLCLVPKTDYQILDTWYAMGMVGTGSKDIEVKDLFVPEPRALASAVMPRRQRASGCEDEPGAAVSGSARRRGRPSALGRCARRSRRRVRDVRRDDGEADRHLHRRQGLGLPGGADQARAGALPDRLGAAPDARVGARVPERGRTQRSARPEHQAALPRAERVRVAQSREAVEVLWSCYGANAIYTRDPLQRYLRDTQTACQHFSFNFDIAGSAFGIAALGGKYVNPSM
jgi:3-hydroxy-9,10-secoandrosta-1,3,5(10)-triene-9,17-dione monooxygenase